MVQIPEYVAQNTLDTDRGGMPVPNVSSGFGKGMEMLGNAISSLSDHMAARQSQKERTAANYAYEDWVQRGQETAHDNVNNAPEDGSGIHDNTIATIKADADKVLATLPKDLQEEFAHKSNIHMSDVSMNTADVEYNQSSTYHSGKVAGIAQGKAAELANDPNKYEANKAELYKYIDDLPLRKDDKAKLKVAADTDLANGKFEGDVKFDAQGVKLKMGISDSGGHYTNGNTGQDSARGKQLAFAQHELTGTEAEAASKLGKATTLEGAVSAGLAYERPKLPAFANRLANARKVLAGTATENAMKARAYFESQGWTPVQASGFVGSLMGESGQHLDPKAYNPKDPGGSEGIGQWNGPRKHAMRAFTGSSGEVNIPGLKSENQSPAPIDAAYQNMPVEWRIQKANQADAIIKQQEVASSNQAKVELSTQIPDAITNYQLHGESKVEPQLEQFLTADPVKGEENYNKFEADKRTAMKYYGMQAMTNDELNAEVTKAKAAIPDGEGSATAQAQYELMNTEANRLKVERDTLANDIIRNRNTSSAEKDRVKRAADAYDKKNTEAAYFHVTTAWDQFVLDSKATEEAAKQLKQLWKDHPFQASLNNPNVSRLWDASAKDKTNPELRRQAISASLEAQKANNIPLENIEVLPTEVAQAITGKWKNPDISTMDKQKEVLAAINMAPDDTSKFAVFNQLRKEGLPSMLEGAIDAALDGREPAAINRLFEAGAISSKDINVSDSDNKINDLAYSTLSTGEGAVYYGVKSGLAVNVGKMNDASQLVAKAAKMRMLHDGTSMEEAVKLSVKDLLGDSVAVETKTSTGVGISVLVPSDIDQSVLESGFRKAADNLTMHMNAMAAQGTEKLKQSTGIENHAAIDVKQKEWAAEILAHMENSTFVKVDGGYALQNNDSHLLIPDGYDSPNPKVYTQDQIMEMGDAAAVEQHKLNMHKTRYR